MKAKYATSPLFSPHTPDYFMDCKIGDEHLRDFEFYFNRKL